VAFSAFEAPWANHFGDCETAAPKEPGGALAARLDTHEGGSPL